MRTLFAGTVGAAVLLGASAAGAAASGPVALPPVKRALAVSDAVPRSCDRALLGGRRGVATATWRAPMSGFVSVRLNGRRGDWDLALVDASSRRVLSASRSFGAREVAQGWVDAGQRLVAQACRRHGRSDRADLRIRFIDAAPPRRAAAPSLVRVAFRAGSDLHLLEELGLDVTHHIHDGQADVIVESPQQLALLRRHGFTFKTRVADLDAFYERAREAEEAWAGLGNRSALPSGRQSYRTFDDYQTELKQLVERNPGLVRKVVLPQRTLQGRAIEGVEIAAGVERADDGRPVFLLVALHHAREWPSGEIAMEFAHMLVDRYGSDPQITDLLTRERVVVVPIINVDGFISSRSWTLPDHNNMASLPPGGLGPQRRKNCRGAFTSDFPCELQYGVDPNRNYGEGWGGVGASTDPLTQTYRGTGPWSEPETQAVHELSQRLQTTMLITLHNVAALVLRPPGRASDGLAPDEDRLRELGDQMAAATGYVSQYGFQLYDTSGTTEDWNYAAQGAFGFTIEIGPANGQFHMAYQTGVVNEWTGTGARAGRGMREALLIAAESGADPADHAIIRGEAKPGRTLRLRKDFMTKSSPLCTYAQGVLRNDVNPVTPLNCVAPGEVISVPDFLDTTLVVPESGLYEWHVNPSTRPFVGPRTTKRLAATPSRSDRFENTQSTKPTVLNLAGQVDPRPTFIERDFSVTPEDATKQLRVRVEWGQPTEDYDLLVQRKNPAGQVVQGWSSATRGSSAEQVVIGDPPVGSYTLRVTNVAAPTGPPWTATVDRFALETVQIPGVKEAWTMTCERGGRVLDAKQVFVDRGEVAEVNWGAACNANRPSSPPGLDRD